MDQDELATQAQIVKEISTTMFTDAVEIMSFLDVLEKGNDKDLKESINKEGAGRTIGHIERALFTRLHLLVARAYAKSRVGDLHAQRAFDLIKDEGVRRAATGNEEEMVKAEADWLRCCGDHRRHSFLHFRDHYLAHLSDPGGIPLPTYKEVIGFSKTTAEAFAQFALGTGVVTLSLESQLPVQRKSTDVFWAKWK